MQTETIRFKVWYTQTRRIFELHSGKPQNEIKIQEKKGKYKKVQNSVMNRINENARMCLAVPSWTNLVRCSYEPPDIRRPSYTSKSLFASRPNRLASSLSKFGLKAVHAIPSITLSQWNMISYCSTRIFFNTWDMTLLNGPQRTSYSGRTTNPNCVAEYYTLCSTETAANMRPSQTHRLQKTLFKHRQKFHLSP